MARRSRWANFADSFNGTYGALNSAFRNIQMGRAMSADYKDDEGNPLTGDALDRARYRALADIETRYGRAAEGLALRSNQAALQATNFENDLNVELRPELLRQRGVLQSGLMEAQTNQANASAASSYALANERNTLLPGRLTAQELTNTGLGLSNDQAALNLNLDRDTYDSKVQEAIDAARQAAADADKAGADAEVAKGTVGTRIGTGLATQRLTEAQALDAETTANMNLAIAPEKIEATIAEFRAQVAESSNREVTAETSARDNSIVADIMSQALERDFGDDPAAANAWIIDQLATADMTPAGRLRAAETVNKFGVEAIGARAIEITQAVRRGWQQGGLAGQIDAYNNVFDDVQLRPERDGNTTRVMIKRGDGNWEVFDEATGSVAEAEAELGSRLEARADNPMLMMEVAAAEAALAQTNAETDRTRAQTGLLNAQIDETRAEMGRGGGLSDEARIAREGLARLMASSDYQYLAKDYPEEAAEVRAEFERAFNMPDAPPTGVPAVAWYNMTLEERAEFRQ